MAVLRLVSALGKAVCLPARVAVAAVRLGASLAPLLCAGHHSLTFHLPYPHHRLLSVRRMRTRTSVMAQAT